MDKESSVTALINAIRERDPELGEELQAKRKGIQEEGRRFKPVLESALEGSETVRPQLAAETIVLRTGRPVLAVRHDEPELTFRDTESEVWRDRLKRAMPSLSRAIRAVGRIELENNPRFDWVGTGWLVKPDVLVTNRHVAVEFGRRSGERFVFRQGTARRAMGASVDFLEEFGSNERRPFRLTEILGIEDEDGPDLAFLRIDGQGLAPEIRLAKATAGVKQQVVVIGYPARDSRIPDQQLVESIFGDVYDKKRLAPGQIIRSAQDDLEHDCSTLGGNSGSVVLDLGTGEALGIHFAGRFLEANYAVAAATLAERLDSILSGESRRKTVVIGGGGTHLAEPTPGVASTSAAALAPSTTASFTFTIPIKVTVDVGVLQDLAPAHSAAGIGGGDQPDVAVSEGVPEDYSGREGYQADFLGEDKEVPLPDVVRNSDEIVEFEFEGKNEHVLRYEHFSVVMNRKRRICFFSAANIDGKLSRKAVRTAWRLDARIPKNLQIIYECYGNSPKFSRGHMTRREDPVWGTPRDAALGNSDSMHVTNVTPQMQTFNAPIWLGLEDYALQNARHDKMKISVITGPILRDSDPVRFGVKIPRAFFKVIVFIHDETGELTATGYSASQDEQLPEFVYGEYDTWQRTIAWIEKAAGISFGKLAEYDPLARETEAPPVALRAFEEIRFRG